MRGGRREGSSDGEGSGGDRYGDERETGRVAEADEDGSETGRQ